MSKILVVIFLILNQFLIPDYVSANPIYKAGLQYEIPKTQQISLRITQIPTKYPWIERDLDWKVKQPQEGSIIVAENIEDLILKDAYGENFIIPQGSKFYAKLSDSKQAQSFWRNGKAELDFYKLEINKQSIDLESMVFDSSAKSQLLGNSVRNIARTGAMTIAGAIAAPLIVFKISSLVGLGFASNPYMLGGAAAVGAGIGLVYGIKQKGKDFHIEPGVDIKLELKDPWLISKELEQSPERTKTPINNNFALRILDIKKSKDEFNDTCLKVSIAYENKTNEMLNYNSFLLTDSMGKEYEPSLTSISGDFDETLPKSGTLNLYFPVDFYKTTHTLQVVRYFDHKVLAQAPIVLKK